MSASVLHPIALLLAAAPALAQVQFEDVTVAAGVDYVQNASNGDMTGGYNVMSGGAVAGDFNGDGWVDLVVTRLDDNVLFFLNRGEDALGTHLGFSDVSERAFDPQPPGMGRNGAACADVDGDGDLDLYLTSLFSSRYELWINDGNGRFTEQAVARGAAIDSGAEHFGFSTSFGDYDRDGYLDIYVCEWGHQSDPSAPTRSHARLLRNRGAAAPGTFVDVTGPAGVSFENTTAVGPIATFNGTFAFTPRFADLDDDGFPDLAITGDFHTSRLFWNNGDGTFLDGTQSSGVGTDENGMGATIGDFDGDGDLDWFITSIFDPQGACAQGGCNWDTSGNRLYLNDGARGFTDRTDAAHVRDGGWGWGAVALDYDNDGRLDLAMTCGIVFLAVPIEDAFNADPVKLWRNTGAGFQDVGASTGFTDTRSGKGMLSLDYDRDGDLDLFVVNNAEHPVLYRNDGGNDNHWLQVTLAASGANRFGIGARVRVWPTVGATPLMHEMHASSNYLAQDECLAHFGLGSHTTVAKLEVRWPSGQLSEWLNVTADQRLQLVEP